MCDIVHVQCLWSMVDWRYPGLTVTIWNAINALYGCIRSPNNMSAECVGGKRLMGVVKIQINNINFGKFRALFQRCGSRRVWFEIASYPGPSPPLKGPGYEARFETIICHDKAVCQGNCCFLEGLERV